MSISSHSVGTKFFIQSIIRESFNPLQERRVLSCLAKSFPKVQRHGHHGTACATPLSFPQEIMSGSSYSIPSCSLSGLHRLLYTLNVLSSTWYLVLDCHRLLLLHQVCPKSVTPHVFWDLEMECQFFNAKGTTWGCCVIQAFSSPPALLLWNQ